MKAHIGGAGRHKLIHTILASEVNVADKNALLHLLHGKETWVWSDQGYDGQAAVIRQHAKRVFGFDRARYRGLAKNRYRLEVTAALANLFMVRHRLPGIQATCR